MAFGEFGGFPQSPKVAFRYEHCTNLHIYPGRYDIQRNSVKNTIFVRSSGDGTDIVIIRYPTDHAETNMRDLGLKIKSIDMKEGVKAEVLITDSNTSPSPQFPHGVFIFCIRQMLVTLAVLLGLLVNTLLLLVSSKIKLTAEEFPEVDHSIQNFLACRDDVILREQEAISAAIAEFKLVGVLDFDVVVEPVKETATARFKAREDLTITISGKTDIALASRGRLVVAST